VIIAVFREYCKMQNKKHSNTENITNLNPKNGSSTICYKHEIGYVQYKLHVENDTGNKVGENMITLLQNQFELNAISFRL